MRRWVNFSAHPLPHPFPKPNQVANCQKRGRRFEMAGREKHGTLPAESQRFRYETYIARDNESGRAFICAWKIDTQTDEVKHIWPPIAPLHS